MNVRKLQSFIKIVELRSFSDAAAALELTQSAISKQMKSFEEELNVPLLIRTSSSVEPTSAGKLVYERGKAMLEEWDRFIAECRSLSGVRVGTLKIGASTVPASYLLPRIVKRLREHYPYLELTIVESDSSSILNLIENREIDIAFVGASRSGHAIRYQPIAEDRLVIVGSSDMKEHPGGGLTLAECARHPFIMREEGSGTRVALEEILAAEGIDIKGMNIAAVSSTTETSLALAEAGVGVTAVSKWALSLPRNVSILAEIGTDRCFYAAFGANRENDPVISLFLHAAAETCRSNNLR